MKTDWIRTSLIVSIAALSFLLVIRFNTFQEQNRALELAQQQDKAPKPVVTDTVDSDPTAPDSQTDSDSGESIDLAVPVAANKSDSLPATSTTSNQQRTIKVHTDVLNLEIDLHGGSVIGASLPKHYDHIDTPDVPFAIMDPDNGDTYYARSNLLVSGLSAEQSKFQFETAKQEYTLDGDSPLEVDLVRVLDNNVKVIKRFTFEKSSYLINVTYLIENNSSEPWTSWVYGQILRDSHNPVVSNSMGLQPFFGAATLSVEGNYEKFSFEDFPVKPRKRSNTPYKNELTQERQGGWISMVQHYFLSAWIPDPEDTNTFNFYKVKGKDLYVSEFLSESTSIAAGETGQKSIQFYIGPKDIKTLEKVSPKLDLTVDYSFLWWIAKPLFFALTFIQSIVVNWGVAIIILTILIKAVFFYPSAASYRSMAKMRKIQPKMVELKERYGDNKQKMSSEMMKLYRDEKVNPLGGCLPILIQMPVFLALYWVLMESVELRHAPFFLWIQDLSVKDPYFILPLIMGGTMFIQQKLNPTPPDPMQARVMQMMPIFFTFLFLFFPAGLVLYWVVNNTLSIAQQYVITKQIERAD